MAKAGDQNNLPPRPSMNMHHFAIPFPRPLAPGQNVTIRFMQAGPHGAQGQHPHFHFVVNGQAPSPVLQDNQGTSQHEEHSRQNDSVQKETKRREEERRAQLREQLLVTTPPSITHDTTSNVVSATWSAVVVEDVNSIQNPVVCYELVKEEEEEGRGPMVVLYSGPSTTCTFPGGGLLPGHTYQFYVMASSCGEKGVASPRALLTFPAQCPDKPLAPKVSSRAKNNIVLKWVAPKDNGSPITAYSLEWDQCGKVFVEVFRGPQKQHRLNHKFLPLTSAHFRLRALNTIGWSDFSDNLVFKSGAGVPSAPPQPILVEAGVCSLGLKWTPPDDNGSPITSYCLEMNDPEAGYGFRPVYQGEEAAYICSGLQRVSTYHFRVAASNDAGTGPFSASVTFQTTPDVPGVPGGPELKARATSVSLHIGWKPPIDTGGTDIQSYILQLADGHQGPFVAAYTGPNLEHTADDLTPGVTYLCRVCAITTAGQGKWTTAVEMKTQPTPPQAPLELKVMGKPAQNSITLKWNPPGFDGGTQLISYGVEMKKDDVWVRVGTVANPLAFGGKAQGTLAFTVLPLTPGSQYVFRVNCFNSCGASPFSEECPCHTAVGYPATPSGLEVGNKTANSIHLRWQPSKEFGSPLTGYQLEYGLSGGDQRQMVTCDPSPSCSYTLKSLLPSSKYDIRVRATSGVGSGDWSSPVECITSPSHPGSPSSLSVLSTTCTTMLISWMSPDSSGAPITQYCVEVFSPHISVCVPATETQYMLENLRPDTAYKLRVQAENTAGKGPFSAYVHGSTLPAPPTSPQLVLVSAGPHYLKVSWGDKKVGQPSLQYVLQSSTDGIRYHKAYQGAATAHRLSKLQPSTAYYLRVAALCDGGQSEWGKPAQFSTTPPTPPAPKDVALSQHSASQLAVSWSAVKYSLPLVYVVQLRTLESDYIQAYEGREASCIVNVLATRGLHKACVRAFANVEVNGSVEKLWSSPSSETQCECTGVTEDGVEKVKDLAELGTAEQATTQEQSSLQDFLTFLKKEKCLGVTFFVGLLVLIVGIIIAGRFYM